VPYDRFSPPTETEGQYEGSDADPPVHRTPDQVECWDTSLALTCNRCKQSQQTARLFLIDGNLLTELSLCADCLEDGLESLDDDGDHENGR
jgi:hypothetical protein